MQPSPAPVQNENTLRGEICRVGRSLFERGYVHATAGNISVRLVAADPSRKSADSGFLITPTDACLGFLEPARLARLDENGHHVSGDAPSKTITLHRRIYAACAALGQDVRCIIHTHSTYCVALTVYATEPATPTEALRELLPPITPYYVMKVGPVPVIPYAYPGSPESAEQVQRAIAHYGEAGVHLRAVMLERLGPNVWHQSPAQAMATLEELEETAKLVWLGGRSARPLGAAQLAELRSRFG